MIQNLIEEIFLKTNGEQMTKEEYAYISSFLGNVNFLVFGTGYDSNLWRIANKNGKTIFLENNKKWITNTEDTFEVFYNTNIQQADEMLERYKEGDNSIFEINLPNELLSIQWDCILVDSPEGWGKKCPGRMQSIYTARVLANSRTNVFIHDCDRYVENLYSQEFFKNKIKELSKLRHMKI